MDRILSQLNDRGIQISEEIVRNTLSEYGLNEHELSDDDVSAVVDELSKSGQLAMNNQEQSRLSTQVQQQQQSNITSTPKAKTGVIQSMMSKTEQSFTAKQEALEEKLQAYQTKKANALIQRVKNVPGFIMSEVVSQLESHDVEHEVETQFNSFLSEFDI